MDPRPTLFLTVGLPGVGKTTRAKELASTHRILRLTPDEWMAPLFGHSDAAGRRDILEGRMIWVAHEVLASGSSVVLDFGCWSAVERYAIRVIAETASGDFTLEYVHASERGASAAGRGEVAGGPAHHLRDDRCRPRALPGVHRAPEPRRTRQRTDPIPTAWTQHLAGLGQLALADIASNDIPG